MRFAILSALSLGLVTPALADDYIGFRSPTGNIACAIFTGEWAGARCDMNALAPTYRQRPADCELDWGSSFAVDAQGQGYLACVGDTVADPGAPVLPYGRSVKLGAFVCASEKTGITCTNGEGHGFQIAKAKQRLF